MFRDKNPPPEGRESDLDRGFPANLDAERFVLGSVLLDDSLYVEVAGALEARDFSLEKHVRIFLRMGELHARGERIDRITLAEELMKHGQLESCDGIGYLVSLDDGLPRIQNVDSYVRIVRKAAVLRRLIFLFQAGMNRAMLREEEPEEIIGAVSAKLLSIESAVAPDTMLRLGGVVEGVEGGFNALMTPGGVRGLQTGFRRFDDMTGGLHRGELVVLAGRPSMGKTSLAMNVALHVGNKLDKRVAVFSLEMSKESLFGRLLCAAACVDAHRYRLGYLDAEERYRMQAAASSLVAAPIFVDDQAGGRLLEMHAKLRRLKAREGLDLAVIDYLQLMDGASRRAQNREQEVAQLSRQIKLMAKDLDVPILLLSQLSRAPETRGGDHRPVLSDLRESGAIEQDSDVVAFVYREEVYHRDREDLRGQAELILAKQRNGPIGIVKLVFLHHLMKFENRLADLGPGAGQEAEG